jgi:imidazolonepropionase-like amidohydrolase
VFEAAQQHGLRVKGHVEQLSNLQGAALVAEFGGLSADHIEYLDEAGVEAMRVAGTVAVLLPGAFYFLRETKSRQSNCCVQPVCRWRCPPTSTPAPARLPPSGWR